jgi:hypothetical protein
MICHGAIGTRSGIHAISDIPGFATLCTHLQWHQRQRMLSEMSPIADTGALRARDLNAARIRSRVLAVALIAAADYLFR